VRDIVRNGVNGFVIDSIRPTEACASRLGELLDQQRRVLLGQAARSTAAEHGWDHVAKAVMDTYQRLLNR